MCYFQLAVEKYKKFEVGQFEKNDTRAFWFSESFLFQLKGLILLILIRNMFELKMKCQKVL